ncbi:MAG: hypothetical protein ACJ8EB_00475 [Allosphingosinicella sp.]
MSHLFLSLLGFVMLTSDKIEHWIGHEIAVGIGAGVVAGGIAGIVLFLHVHTTDTLKERLDLFANAGMQKIFRHRSVRIKDEYDRRLAHAHEIDVLGWGLSAFREDYEDQFEQWSQRAKVRILVINPDFPRPECSLADIRDGEEGRPIGDIRQHVAAFRAALAARAQLNKDRFRVRQMNALPAINLLRADDEIFWGPYLMGQQSRNTATILVRRGGYLFDALKDHFNAVWERSAPDL